jgi:lysophospholipase L1-like esterase
VSFSSARRKSQKTFASLGIAAFLLGVIAPTVIAAPTRNMPKIGPNGQGTLLVIGDSLTVGTDAFGSLSSKLLALGTWNKATINAKVGRTASAATSILTKSLTPSTTAIVVALGTNDMISKTATSYPKWVIDKVMSATALRPVLWVNLEFSSATRPDLVVRAKRFNTELRRAMKRWPNLTVADWNKGFVPNRTSRFIADGVHLSVQGYRTRAKFMVPSIASFGEVIVNASTTTSTPTTTSTTIAPTTTNIPTETTMPQQELSTTSTLTPTTTTSPST